MSYITRNPKRTIGALATILAASGVAVGSGASFSSQTENPGISATSGTLKMTNSKPDASTFATNPTNLKPGDVRSSTVTITNSGTLKSIMTLDVAGTSSFSEGKMKLEVLDGTSVVYTDSDAVLTQGPIALGSTPWNAGEARTYTVRWTFDPSALNADQERTATASLTWKGAQQAGTNE